MLPNKHLDDILSIPVDRLAKAGKVRVEIVPDLDALYLHFARSIADEIKAHNADGSPTRLNCGSRRITFTFPIL
jgi:hypothetical protein